MRALDDMCEVLEYQIREISKKGNDISPQELDNAYKAVDIIKDIKTIEAMQKAEESGMFDGYSGADYSYGSMRMPYPHMMYNRPMYGSYEDGGNSNASYEGSYRSYEGGNSMAGRRGMDGDGDGRYSEDYSGRRGRGADGRYVSRDGGSYGYSGAETKEELKRKIHEMQTKLNNM